MRTSALYPVFAATLAVLSACTLKPQYLHLDPTVSVRSASIGNGTTIGLAVEDNRGSQKLGEVGDPNTQMVEVNLTEDFRPRLYEEIAKALASLGFNVVPYSDAMERTITVDVRKLELSSVKQPFVFDTELRAEVGTVARNGKDTYDRLYYVRTRKETAGPPFLKDSNALINTAVAQALEDMLNDERLLEVLAR
ncbi:MAG TPA: YajG family lipoprotein [Burkholderiales bacterium]|jgi:uncharacterized lipoprotein YajG|nr:YajG family lipoprotein [Burkholderiales bacterium]